jgi:hypothetical protein
MGIPIYDLDPELDDRTTGSRDKLDEEDRVVKAS